MYNSSCNFRRVTVMERGWYAPITAQESLLNEATRAAFVILAYRRQREQTCDRGHELFSTDDISLDPRGDSSGNLTYTMG
jgi:hypothetical protein